LTHQHKALNCRARFHELHNHDFSIAIAFAAVANQKANLERKLKPGALNGEFNEATILLTAVSVRFICTISPLAFNSIRHIHFFSRFRSRRKS
jgi:hypothetical protein